MSEGSITGARRVPGARSALLLTFAPLGQGPGRRVADRTCRPHGACVPLKSDEHHGFRMRSIYTSVRMLDGPQNIATFCHFHDELDDYFGWSRGSASSISIIE